MKMKMKKGSIALIAVGVVILLIVVWGVSAYNGMVSGEEEVNGAYSDIESDLQRRNDLIPNLVETVKGYAEHEEEIFTAVSDAYSDMLTADTSNPEDLSQADAELTSALDRLLALTTSYPDLEASENFKDLQVQLEGTENRINVSRKNYNDAVEDYNSSLRTFPNSIIAGMGGFESFPYFEAEEGAEEVPDVSFE